MKRAIGWMLGLAVLGLLACTSANEQALARMSSAQRAHVSDKLDRLQAGMSERQVTQILGPPRKGSGTPRVCYDPPEKGSQDTLCVKFKLYKASEVEWTMPGAEDSAWTYIIDLNAKGK